MAKDFQPERDALDEELEEWLPKRGDRLFAPSNTGARLDPLGFTGPGEPRSPIGRWQLYSDAFLHAADRLVDTTSGAPHEDELIYPILALYRHHLELELKRLIRLCANESWSSRLPTDPEVLNRWNLFVAEHIGKKATEKAARGQVERWLGNEHDLERLWRGLAGIYPSGLRWASEECTQACAELIAELNVSDPNSQGSRYPRKKNGTETLAGLEVVDLRVLKSGIHKVSHYLGATEEQVGEDHD